jgi:hypothetical protein
VRLQAVAGPEERGKLVFRKEMRHIALDLAVQSGRKNEGIEYTERVHVLAQFPDC